MSRCLRMWAMAAILPLSSSLLAQVQITIRVLQSERVPYDVQAGEGKILTSCSILGSISTGEAAVVSGNTGPANTRSTPSLSMDCNSPQAPPPPARHLLNVMLVMGSNSTAYIIACENTWRWSKCRSLAPHNIYRAKLTSKGMAVEYMDKGQLKERPYHILETRAAQ